MTRASATSDGGRIVAGTYRVLDKLGEGSMGEVFEAEHVRLGSRVAVKFLRAGALAEPRAVSRFQSEARAMAGLQSEQVVRVFDCGELPDGTPYLVMERLLGEDLRSLLARVGPLPVARAVRLAIDACQGLTEVHGSGMVHRDLKPANLFVTRRDANTEVCKILDFGVAKVLDGDRTLEGHLLGTVRYMAPEQIEDASSATERSDVYALAAILYESLSGSPPHAGSTLQKTMFEILNGRVRPLSELCEVPVGLERVLSRALSKRPEERPLARELLSALRPFARAAAEGAPTLSDESLDVVAPTAAQKPRGRSLLIGTLLSATFGLGLLGGRAFEARSGPSRPDAATALAEVPPPEVTAPERATEPPGVASAAAPEPAPAASATPTGSAPNKRRDLGISQRFDAKNPYAD